MQHSRASEPSVHTVSLAARGLAVDAPAECGPRKGAGDRKNTGKNKEATVAVATRCLCAGKGSIEQGK